MGELATITAIEHGKITVVSQIKSSCNNCSQVDTCASGQVAKAIPHKKLSFTLIKPTSMENQNINVGDCVVLTLPEVDLLKSAWQVYLLPILGLFLFSALGQWLHQVNIFPNELIALTLGVFGGYLGFRLARHFQSKPDNQERLEPKILRVLPKPFDVNKVITN
jgi:sigma-E factor negative regulatory protein RseC